MWRRYVEEVLAARELAYEGLTKLGIKYFPSEANFVLFQAGERGRFRFATLCGSAGVLVRDRSYEIPGCVRVTIGTREQIETVFGGIGDAVGSMSMFDMIVFDMDGVLTEVSESLSRGDCADGRAFHGAARFTRDLIQEYKNQGGWNNDWALSQKIAADLGVEVEYGDVVERV